MVSTHRPRESLQNPILGFCGRAIHGSRKLCILQSFPSENWNPVFFTFESRVSTRRWRACNFSLPVQSKVTQRKHTPAGRPPGILACGCARCVRVPLTARRCADSGMSAIHRGPPAGFCSRCRPPCRGPNRSALLRAEEKAGALQLLLLRQDAARMGPLWCGEGAQEKPAGWRAQCAPVRCMYMDVHSANPVAPSRTRRAGCPESAPPGWPSLWLLSLGHTRQSSSLANGERKLCSASPPRNTSP